MELDPRGPLVGDSFVMMLVVVRHPRLVMTVAVHLCLVVVEVMRLRLVVV